MLFILTLLAFDLRTGEKAPPDAVPAAIRKSLDPSAIEFLDGETLKLTIWLRRGIAVKATQEQIKNGLTYRELPESTLLGIVSFESKWTDFRKQEIATGTYSLRLIIQPDTGDHKETAPHTEFLLLSPIALETSTDELDASQVVERSRKATGGDHPAVMLLFPGKVDGDKPKLESKDREIKVIHVKRSVEIDGKSVPLAFGITVEGFSEKR